MHETAAARDARCDHPRMDLALRVAFPKIGEHFQMRVVLDIGGLAQQLDLARRFHPAHRITSARWQSNSVARGSSCSISVHREAET